MGLLHLGIITSYLSDALVSGLTTGAAVHVFTSQVVYCLGISEVPRFGSVGKIVRVSLRYCLRNLYIVCSKIRLFSRELFREKNNQTQST